MVVQEPPGDSQGNAYRMKLKSALAEAFDEKELQELTELAECRKPLQRMRQMRGRVVDVVTTAEGLSYMDHHQGTAPPFFIFFFFFFSLLSVKVELNLVVLAQVDYIIDMRKVQTLQQGWQKQSVHQKSWHYCVDFSSGFRYIPNP